MGNFFGKKVKVEEKVDVPLVVSAVGAGGSPSQFALSATPVAEQPNLLVQSGVNVKDALQGKLGFLGSMFGGQQITLDRNIHDLNTVDDSLGMKTEVRDPSAFSVWELVGKLADDRGYKRTAMIFREFNTISKVNMVSFDRKGRRELKEIYASRQGVEDNTVGEDDSTKDKLLGKRVSR